MMTCFSLDQMDLAHVRTVIILASHTDPEGVSVSKDTNYIPTAEDACVSFMILSKPTKKEASVLNTLNNSFD